MTLSDVLNEFFSHFPPDFIQSIFGLGLAFVIIYAVISIFISDL